MACLPRSSWPVLSCNTVTRTCTCTAFVGLYFERRLSLSASVFPIVCSFTEALYRKARKSFGSEKKNRKIFSSRTKLCIGGGQDQKGEGQTKGDKRCS